MEEADEGVQAAGAIYAKGQQQEGNRSTLVWLKSRMPGSSSAGQVDGSPINSHMSCQGAWIFLLLCSNTLRIVKVYKVI